jgi:1,4-alpha-glucan branching enzyme
LNDNKWYVANWDNSGYNDTKAVFMEFSAEPVNITNVSWQPYYPESSEQVTVSVETSGTPSAEEKLYVRYSVDNWQSWSLSEVTMNGTTGTAVIPAFPDDTTVNFYLFSTAFSNPATDIDLVTVHYNNNDGSNYEYTVGEGVHCGADYLLTTTTPQFPQENAGVTITFNARYGNGGLEGYNDTVYAHTGVITSESSDDHDWKHVKTDWGENTPDTRLTKIGEDLYRLVIPDINSYYGVNAGEKILKMAFVFRSKEAVNGSFLEGKTEDNQEILIDVYDNELHVRINHPTGAHPVVEKNSGISFCAVSLLSDTLRLFIDDRLLGKTSEDSLSAVLNSNDYTDGEHWLIAKAESGRTEVLDSVMIYIRGTTPVAELPAGVQPGINYQSNSSVTLVLHDPAKLKKYTFLIGDFNGWKVCDDGYMNRTPDGEYYWITLNGLTPGEEYAYQYYVDGQLKLADPFCDKILDPDNDKYIPASTYPDLKPYPQDKTTGIVSVFQTAQQPYSWAVSNFVPEAINATQPDLVIYELLIRDFVADRKISTIIDTLDYLKKLGVNAIELMPFNEFEGNDSWGYNPDFYFATDKAYGTKNDYKTFIDSCHAKGIAVIMDIVTNHSFGQAPMAMMYWDDANNRPSPQNPWYNPVAPHPFGFGQDFNHESPYTRDFFKRVYTYWTTEYKIDGFRLDLSKGLTQKYSADVAQWNQYDQSRIDILTDYYNHIKSVNANAYMILEHLADNDEEKVLANTGMLLWGNMNHQFNQATMGFADNSDFSWAYYGDRDFTYPNLIPYMESHDEERLMYKNLTYGNASGSYDIKDTTTALERIEAVTPLYFMVPGPKMIWQFGELGYDYSINRCPDGSVSEDCRTSAKPIRWDYWNDPHRQKVYQVYAAMAKLKKEQQAFEQGTFSKDLSGLGKRAWVSHSSLNVCTGANLDVSAFSMIPGFQHNGWWYDYLSGDSVYVADETTFSLNLQPGDYYVYTDQRLTRPFAEVTVKVVDDVYEQPLPGVTVTFKGYGRQVTDSVGEVRFIPDTHQDYTFSVIFPEQKGDTTGVITVEEEDFTKTVKVSTPAVASDSTLKSGNWTEARVWASGYIPKAGTNVEINDSITVTTSPANPARCKNLKVNTGGKLILETGKMLKIEGGN